MRFIPLLVARASSAVSSASYTIDLAATGATFDGIGAISGGGGETVLLPSYPAEQQAQVLDYLFKPSYGAALHILKVEIGGDALSTDGAEPSHMHTEHDAPNFERGYENWVASAAKQRSPGILLYALPWEWPAWVGDGTADPFHNLSKPLHYVMEWLRGAADVHQLAVDYIGVWNECHCSPDYVLALRSALDQSRFNSTRIIAPDGATAGANALIQTMANDSALAAAVHAVGYHYPNSDPAPPAGARATLPGLRLWASEDDSTVNPPEANSSSTPDTPRPRKQPGGGCLVRTINQNWVQGGITATIVWNLVMARYPQLRWDYTGLVAATDPFGGHYDVLPPVWAAAHTTQFTAPGWQLLQTAAGSGSGSGSGSGWLQHGGTYVTYVGPATPQSPGGGLTIVIEKMDEAESRCQRGSRPTGQQAITAAENATFTLRGLGGLAAQGPAGGSLSHGRLHVGAAESLAVWASHFGGDEPGAGLFTRLPDAVVVDGAVSIEVLPNWAYTLSTVRTASKGGEKGGDTAAGRDASGDSRGDASGDVSTSEPTAAGQRLQPRKQPMRQPPLSPPPGHFPWRYADDFEQCALSGLPRFVAPMAGAFECEMSAGGRAGGRGTVLRQRAPALAICDRGDVMPYAIIGDGFRTTYNVSVDVLLPPAQSPARAVPAAAAAAAAGAKAGAEAGAEEAVGGGGGGDGGDGGAFIGARTKGPVGSFTGMDGVFFAVNNTGWHVALKVGALGGGVGGGGWHGGPHGVLASGPLPLPPAQDSDRPAEGTWHRLSLVVSGTTATASIDGVVVAPALAIPAPYEHYTGRVGTFSNGIGLGKGGYASFGTVGYADVQFDALAVDSSA
jgi:galactosylceramidase